MSSHATDLSVYAKSFSSYSDQRRKDIGCQRLVFVDTNLRLSEKVTDIDYEEKTVDWSEWSDYDGEEDAE